jgi:hypothetical protein
MEYSKNKRILYLLILLSAVSLFLPLYRPVTFISGVIQSFILPGLVFFFLIGDRNRPWADDIFMIPLVSPVLFTLTVLITMRLTGDHLLSLRLSAGLFYLLFIVCLITGRDHLGKRESPVPRGAVFLSVAYGLLIMTLYTLNELLLIRVDSWYHASVTSEILARGIPPMEPWLPEQPIRYMWIYHLFLASFKRLSGLELFRAMGLFNIVIAFSFPYLIARIISALISGSRRIFWSTLISIAGLESASWIAWPLVFTRTIVGEVKGSAEISRIIGDLKFNGREMLHVLTPFGASMVNLHDKFITITAFGYSLDLFLICFIVFLSRSYIERSRTRAAILFFTLILGSFLFHVIIGTALICTVVGAGILLHLFDRFVTKKPSGLYARLMPSIMAVAVAAIGLPYFASLGGTETGGGSFLGEYIHFGLRNITTILLPLLILFFASRRAFRKIFSLNSDNYALMASWIIPLLALNVLVDLPTANEDKLIFPLFLLLGPAISIEITGVLQNKRGARKILFTAWILLLFIVPPLLTYYAFITYTPWEVEIENRYEALSGDREFFHMIGRETGRDAIVAEKGIDHLSPVLAQRRNLSGERSLATVYGYDMDYILNYQNLNEAIFSCGPLDRATIDSLGSLDFDLYIALYNRDLKECPFLASKFEGKDHLFKLVHSGRKGKLYHFEKPEEY